MADGWAGVVDEDAPATPEDVGAREDAERQLLLLSAGTAARREAESERALDLMEHVSWTALVQRLGARKLMPPLGPRILELSEGRESKQFAEAVHQSVTATRHQGAFMHLVCQRVTDALLDAGVRSAPLKGFALAEAIYGDLGRRLSNDIDLLVAPQDLYRAASVVRELGYVDAVDQVDSNGFPLLHFALVHERGELPPIELHWRIHWYERSFAHERLLPPTTSAQGNWRPAPTDEFASLLLFYARDGFVDLRLATDLSQWWDVLGGEMEPGSLTTLLRVYPSLTRVASVAAKAAEATVGIPSLSQRPLGVRDRLALRLANPNPTSSRAQLYADMGFIDGLLCPPGGLRSFVRRQVLVPKEVLDGYAQQAPRWPARSSLEYGLRVLVRYGLSLLRALRAPQVSVQSTTLSQSAHVEL